MRLTVTGQHPPISLLDRYQLRSEGAEAWNLLVPRDADVWPRLRDAGRVLTTTRGPGLPRVAGEVDTSIGPGLVVSPYIGVTLDRMPPRVSTAVATWLLAEVAGSVVALGPNVHRGLGTATLFVGQGRRFGIAGVEALRPATLRREAATVFGRPAPAVRFAPEQQDGERFDVPATMVHNLAAMIVGLMSVRPRTAWSPEMSEDDWRRMLDDTSASADLRALLLRCLRDDPTARVDAADLAWCAQTLWTSAPDTSRLDPWLEHARPDRPDRGGLLHGEVLEPRAFVDVDPAPVEVTPSAPIAAHVEDAPSTRWVRVPVPVHRPVPQPVPNPGPPMPFAGFRTPDETRAARAEASGRSLGDLSKGALLGLMLAVVFYALAAFLGR